jgi:hypothetical protein
VTFFNNGIAEIACVECGMVYRTVDYRVSDLEGIYAHGEATHTWRCAQGHVLYRERIEMSFFVRARPSDDLADGP